MAAPPAPRALLRLLALALLIGPGAALSLIGASRPSVTAAGSSSSASRDAPLPGAAARLQPAPVSALDLPAPPVRLHVVVVALAIAPAGRRLLAFPAESLEAAHAHGAGDQAPAAATPAPPPAGSDDAAGVHPRRAPSAFVRGDQRGFLPRDVNGATNGTAAPGFLALPASPTRPQLIALAPAPSLLSLTAASQGASDEPAAEAVPGCAAREREAPLPPRAACTLVSCVGVGGAGTGALEFAHVGEDRSRFFVIQEHTGAANATAWKQSGGAWTPSSGDDDTDAEWESDCSGDDGDGNGDFSQPMEQFRAVLGHAVTAMEVIPWLPRVWEMFLQWAPRVWAWFLQLLALLRLH